MYGQFYNNNSYINKTTKLDDGRVLVERTPTLMDTTVALLLAPLWVYPVFFLISFVGVPLFSFIFQNNGLANWQYENFGTILTVVSWIAFGIPVVTAVMLAIKGIERCVNKHKAGEKCFHMDDNAYVRAMTGHNPKTSSQSVQPATEEFQRKLNELNKQHEENMKKIYS